MPGRPERAGVKEKLGSLGPRDTRSLANKVAASVDLHSLLPGH